MLNPETIEKNYDGQLPPESTVSVRADFEGSVTGTRRYLWNTSLTLGEPQIVIQALLERMDTDLPPDMYAWKRVWLTFEAADKAEGLAILASRTSDPESWLYLWGLDRFEVTAIDPYSEVDDVFVEGVDEF